MVMWFEDVEKQKDIFEYQSNNVANISNRINRATVSI
jgi:hypothetical protein